MSIHLHPCDYRGIQQVSVQGRVETRFSDAALTNMEHMQLMGKIDLHSPLQFIPLRVAAQKQVEFLREQGERVPDSCARFQLTPVLNQYLLCSSIVVVGNAGGELSWVTKSEAALRGLFPELASEQQQKGITRQLAEATPSYSEIVDGRFAVIRITASEEGYSIDKVSISVEAKLIPYFILHTFRAKLIHYLRNEKVVISFKQGKGIHKILTSLRPKLLVSQFGVDSNRADKFFPRDWHRGRAKLGYLSLPNMETGKFQSIPLHKVVHISDPRS